MPTLAGTDIKWKQCATHGKRTYVTEKSATSAAFLLHPVEDLRAYPCREAKGWHIGHPKRRTGAA